jgi:hypothetical protein
MARVTFTYMKLRAMLHIYHNGVMNNGVLIIPRQDIEHQSLCAEAEDHG